MKKIVLLVSFLLLISSFSFAALEVKSNGEVKVAYEALGTTRIIMTKGVEVSLTANSAGTYGNTDTFVYTFHLPDGATLVSHNWYMSSAANFGTGVVSGNTVTFTATANISTPQVWTLFQDVDGNLSTTADQGIFIQLDTSVAVGAKGSVTAVLNGSSSTETSGNCCGQLFKVYKQIAGIKYHKFMDDALASDKGVDVTQDNTYFEDGANSDESRGVIELASNNVNFTTGDYYIPWTIGVTTIYLPYNGYTGGSNIGTGLNVNVKLTKSKDSFSQAGDQVASAAWGILSSDLSDADQALTNDAGFTVGNDDIDYALTNVKPGDFVGLSATVNGTNAIGYRSVQVGETTVSGTGLKSVSDFEYGKNVAVSKLPYGPMVGEAFSWMPPENTLVLRMNYTNISRVGQVTFDNYGNSNVDIYAQFTFIDFSNQTTSPYKSEIFLAGTASAGTMRNIGTSGWRNKLAALSSPWDSSLGTTAYAQFWLVNTSDNNPPQVHGFNASYYKGAYTQLKMGALTKTVTDGGKAKLYWEK